MLAFFIINSIVVAVTVLMHYECLYRISVYIPKINISPRKKIVFGVFGSLIAHAIEVWMFAVAIYFMHKTPGWGTLEGAFHNNLMDSAYYSFTVFTTLGFGDIQPTGNLRYLTGIESLTGLVLITWSASFLYFEMEKYWGESNQEKGE